MPAWKTSAKESQPQKTQKNKLKWKRQKTKKDKKKHKSRLTIWWELLITFCTSQPLSCTWPSSDLWATPLKGVKDFCSATLGSKWRKTGWAEVQAASFLLTPVCTLSPPSLQHAAVIAACDLFLDELSFSSVEIFEGLSNVLVHPGVTPQPFHFRCLKRKLRKH